MAGFDDKQGVVNVAFVSDSDRFLVRNVVQLNPFTDSCSMASHPSFSPHIGVHPLERSTARRPSRTQILYKSRILDRKPPEPCGR